MSKKRYKVCCVCNHKYDMEDSNNINKPLPKTCPTCRSKWWDKPKVERDLQVLQENYFSSNREDMQSFNEMIVIVEGLLNNIIVGRLRSSDYYMDDEKRHDLVTECVLVFWKKFNNPRKSNFRITGSFIAYLNRMVLNPLYNKKKQTREKSEISMFTPVTSDGSLSILDMLGSQESVIGSEEEILNKIQENIQIEAILSLLENLFTRCVANYDLKTALIVLKAIQLQLDPSSDPKNIVSFFEYYSNNERVIADYSLKIIYDFLREEILGNNTVISYEEYVEKFGIKTNEEEEASISHKTNEELEEFL